VCEEKGKERGKEEREGWRDEESGSRTPGFTLLTVYLYLVIFTWLRSRGIMPFV